MFRYAAASSYQRNRSLEWRTSFGRCRIWLWLPITTASRASWMAGRLRFTKSGKKVALTPSTYSPDYRHHIVDKVVAWTKRGSTVFSLGCGNGFVEAELIGHCRKV